MQTRTLFFKETLEGGASILRGFAGGYKKRACPCMAECRFVSQGLVSHESCMLAYGFLGPTKCVGGVSTAYGGGGISARQELVMIRELLKHELRRLGCTQKAICRVVSGPWKARRQEIADTLFASFPQVMNQSDGLCFWCVSVCFGKGGWECPSRFARDAGHC